MSAREHLPQDIIRILVLERLGKVETTSFDKLYYLTQNCTDRYYMKVIQTFVKLIKRNTANRQIVLVNTARASKYLAAYGQRQTQLFTVLEKYHQVPDGLEDLKSQFHFLKEELLGMWKICSRPSIFNRHIPQPCAVMLMLFSQELIN